MRNDTYRGNLFNTFETGRELVFQNWCIKIINLESLFKIGKKNLVTINSLTFHIKINRHLDCMLGEK